MASIEVIYDGHLYYINNFTLDEAKEFVLAAVQNGGGWLQVTDGGGPTHLFIAPGVPIAFIPQPPRLESE